MTRELLQQVFDALERMDKQSPYPVETKLITALKSALAAPQPEPDDYQMLVGGVRWTHCAKHIYDACIKEGVGTVRALYAAAPAPAVPTISPLALRALRMADMALASWENGYAFDSHGPGREAQRLVTDALALSAAPAAPDGAVPPGSWEHLKVMMQHSAWEGTLQLSDALANIDDFAKSAAPAVQESQDERAAFEAWAKSMGLDLYSVVGAQDSANPFGGYTRYAYEAWMARAALGDKNG